MSLRLLLIIFDGLGDRPAPELGGKTPLEAAHTPNLDRFARESITGALHPKSPGYPLGSPIALHLLFGYPESQFPDRGPLIARARGHNLRSDEVMLTARFSCAAVDFNRLQLVQRFVTDREDACMALASAIAEYDSNGLHFRYAYSGRGDGILFIRGGASFQITDTDPLALDLPVLRSQPRLEQDADGQYREVEPDGSAQRTADALNEYLAWVHHTLRDHPASVLPPATDGASTTDQDVLPINTLITKWAGPKPALEPFREKWGMRAVSLPDEEVVHGLMYELDFSIVKMSDPEPEQDLRLRLREARTLLRDGYELVHLHTKYPDPSSHQNDPPKCVQELEALDRAMGEYWQDLAADPELVTVLTTDHTTPSVWSHIPRGQFCDQHGGEPVPIAIRGGNVRVDGVAAYDERSVTLGGLGHLRGEDFMPVLLTAAERTNMYEMRPTPKRRLYMPSRDQLDALRIDPPR